MASNRVWTLQVLATHRDQQLPAPRDGYVFAHPGGRPYTHGYLTRRFIRLIRREGLPPIRLHDLRHGTAGRRHVKVGKKRHYVGSHGHEAVLSAG